jgi:serine O-acetyltransferase
VFFKGLVANIDSIMQRDPAARSRLEVLFCYPGLHAVLWHRLAHALWRRGLFLLGRLMAHLGRMLTGIEIHPAARIARGLMIDHGAGVVIGETAEIGRDVTLYQGVTLGGTSLSGGKRHPTLMDGVIVGAGAQVLGPITVGAGARIGANAVVLKDVPAGVTMVGIPARIAMAEPAGEAFTAYGTPSGDLPDPVVRAIDTLRAQVTALESRLRQVEGHAPSCSVAGDGGAANDGGTPTPRCGTEN